MKVYVEVIEILSRIVEIDADDESEAIETAKKMYRDCEIVLEADDWLETEYKIYKEV